MLWSPQNSLHLCINDGMQHYSKRSWCFGRSLPRASEKITDGLFLDADSSDFFLFESRSTSERLRLLLRYRNVLRIFSFVRFNDVCVSVPDCLCSWSVRLVNKYAADLVCNRLSNEKHSSPVLLSFFKLTNRLIFSTRKGSICDSLLYRCGKEGNYTKFWT